MLLRSLRLQRLLSFGPEAPTVELRSLNILIGPNGSGKSNFIDAIGLLRAAPTELQNPVRDSGDILAWIWQGPGEARAELEAVVCNHPESRGDLRHRLAFVEAGQRFKLDDERVEFARPKSRQKKPFLFFGYERGRPMLTAQGERRELRHEQIDPQRSILAQRRDPDQYPELTYLADAYGAIRLYRSWNFGRYAPPRQPQPASLPNDYLLEDASNLGLVLNHLRMRSETKSAVLSGLRRLYDGIVDYDVRVLGGTVQIFLEETGGRVIPATRLSDGTLRWLALLAVLLDPSPPRLICIEEPELGLHPDLLGELARLLRDAAGRTQLVVTTHSSQLVDAFTDAPESILVCERHEGTTSMQRLDPERLAVWLERYGLGELWAKGELGGTRW
ncbi:AAA family ATPase [Nannocystis pusilla]|uniref:AAA family ATPase n=1 Tax=Nannocystis pusilla TaxID=889268 RepID=A0A9X3J2X2_9BACT|nr:AAA family ATPase [Nannocystis pusilla]MCY1013121.1 AAA family ATPase [Nannocystis pusilla]